VKEPNLKPTDEESFALPAELLSFPDQELTDKEHNLASSEIVWG